MRNKGYFDAAELVTQYLKNPHTLEGTLELCLQNIVVGLEATFSLLRHV